MNTLNHTKEQANLFGYSFNFVIPNIMYFYLYIHSFYQIFDASLENNFKHNNPELELLNPIAQNNIYNFYIKKPLKCPTVNFFTRDKHFLYIADSPCEIAVRDGKTTKFTLTLKLFLKPSFGLQYPQECGHRHAELWLRIQEIYKDFVFLRIDWDAEPEIEIKINEKGDLSDDVNLYIEFIKAFLWIYNNVLPIPTIYNMFGAKTEQISDFKTEAGWLNILVG